MTATTTISIRQLNGFADPAFTPADWERVLATGESNVVFLTWHWQSTWWETFARGELMLMVAERDGEAVALAPWFTEAGMVYFVGSGSSDYLDFIGDISDPQVLDALLAGARNRVKDFIGFVFYLVPENSETGWRLKQAAARLGLKIFEESSLLAPALEMGTGGKHAIAGANKKSLLRHERRFTREQPLNVEHLIDGKKILPHLAGFFAQHIERRAATTSPSMFHDERQQAFFIKLAERAAETGWLRFTRIEWQGRTIAYHFGFCYRGSFLWYKPTFAINLAHDSPGEVLLRQLLLRAVEEGAHTFDFGLGEEVFKARFANQINIVRDWGLYDPRAIEEKKS